MQDMVKINSKKIKKILSRYESNKIKIGTICSHSALQIFHGAKQEGFKTLGIATPERKFLYESFLLSKPDEYLIVKNFRDVLNSENQNKLLDENVIIIPHGSFVEYVGAENIENIFHVPIFGNRKTLSWERDRRKQREWLEKSGLKLPQEYKDPSEINGKVFVKLPGAKGGRGYFVVNSEKEFYSKLEEKVKKGVISKKDSLNVTIQEFISGVRYYPHFFYSLFEMGGMRVAEGRIELLGVDKRIEPIDESYRGLPQIPEEFFDYTVTGNQPIILRESLLPNIMRIGADTVNASLKLFPPGMLGAFSIETIYHPDRGFRVFEISARIVAGTNLYPLGSPYSCYLFNEPMSSGRRIAREIRKGLQLDRLEKVIS